MAPEDDQRRRKGKHAFTEQARHIIGDSSTSLDSKVDWLESIFDDKDTALTYNERRVLELEAENNEYRITIGEMTQAHDNQIYDAIRHRLQTESTAAALPDAEGSSGTKARSQIASAEASNELLSAATEQQLELLGLYQGDHKQLREQLSNRDRTIQAIDRNLKKANSTVKKFKATLARRKRNYAEYADSVNDLLGALKSENAALKKRLEKEHDKIDLLWDQLKSTYEKGMEGQAEIVAGMIESMKRARRKIQMAPGSHGRRDPDTPMFEAPDLDSDVEMINNCSDAPLLKPLRSLHLNSDPSPPPRPRSPRDRTRGRSPIRRKRPQTNAGLAAAMESYVLGLELRGLGDPRPSQQRRTSVPATQPLPSRQRPRDEMLHIPIIRKRALNPDDPPRPIKKARHHLINPDERRNVHMLCECTGRVTLNDITVAGVEAKITTMPKPASSRLPGQSIFTGPIYLPAQRGFTSLSAKIARVWGRPVRKWTLGPDMGNKGSGKATEDPLDSPAQAANKNQDSQTQTNPLETQTEETGRWKTWVILFLALWLFLSHCSQVDHKKEWLRANEDPERLLAMLRGPEANAAGGVTVMDFEIARWSDVDASALG
ncbi:hypothetical protein P175DRAFT_0524094 [Aspergillus ochraceoroseus IBT 24754]|uniref:Uncharacterized protein n=1 Tax=Aspergillus ochraceoroseus IBT 24754 TaxID=1392256 RepID=A0A2T5LU02_9EURO|nr:uncharacterized protein P175DRAFT_0524094 [Aspergillus ochraceoroseus IBT 24754]PTU19761.1 hypothetical protein P175DRAFT_0524094 [Aspergillus ochraceoroseus IBT 24754]